MPINVFVSYSEKDQLAATLVSTLRTNADVRLFIAHQARTPGQSIQQKVDAAIAHCHVFLLLWTARSQASEWVGYEIETAQRMGRRVLPVLVENVVLPRSLRDVEAVPFYLDSDRGMAWLTRYFGQMASASTARGGGVNWGALVKGGLVAAIGVAAAAMTESKDGGDGAGAARGDRTPKPGGQGRPRRSR
jgi:hypothetical protein